MAIAGDIFKIVINYLLPGSTIAQNVFHWRYDGLAIIPDSDVVDDFEVWASTWAFAWNAQASNKAEVLNFTIAKRQPLGGFLDIGGADINVAGNSIQDMLPHGVAALARATVTGSRGQGRKFVPGFVEGDQAEGIWDIGVLTIMGLLTLIWVQDPSLLIGITNNYTSGVHNDQTSTFKSFAGSTFINTIVNYQRRRRPGVGI